MFRIQIQRNTKILKVIILCRPSVRQIYWSSYFLVLLRIVHWGPVFYCTHTLLYGHLHFPFYQSIYHCFFVYCLLIDLMIVDVYGSLLFLVMVCIRVETMLLLLVLNIASFIHQVANQTIEQEYNYLVLPIAVCYEPSWNDQCVDGTMCTVWNMMCWLMTLWQFVSKFASFNGCFFGIWRVSVCSFQWGYSMPRVSDMSLLFFPLHRGFPI